MDGLRTDFIHVLRAIRARFWSSAVITVVLGIGLGLTTTMFAITDPYLSRPLPYPHPEQLVVVQASRLGPPIADPTVELRPAPTLDDLRARTDVFDDVSAYDDLLRLRLPGAEGISILKVRKVSSNFLPILGFGSTATSDLILGPASKDGPRMLFVQERHRFWTGPISGGNTLRDENGVTFVTAAVLPSRFLFPEPRVSARPDALSLDAFGPIAERGLQRWTGIARLKPGLNATQAGAALEGLGTPAGLRLNVQPLTAVMMADLRPLALGAVICGMIVTVICIANVANLITSRGVYRARDFMTRVHLGATRPALIRLVGIEAGAMSMAGVLAALAIAYMALKTLSIVMPEQYMAAGEPAWTWRAAAFAATLGLAVTGVCTSVSWLAIRSCLTGFSRVHTGEPKGVRWVRGLTVAVQSAFAIVLVVASALLLRSYANLWLQGSGYQGDAKIITVSFVGSTVRASLDMATRTIGALKRVPGVADAAAAVGVGYLQTRNSTVGGDLYQVDGRNLQLIFTAQVTPTYFDVVGTRLLAGRTFSDADAGANPLVVNQTFLAAAWPGAPPPSVIGRTVTVSRQPAVIVGVVEDARDRALDSSPVIRAYKPIPLQIWNPSMSYAVKPGQTQPSLAAIRQAVISIDPGVYIQEISSVNERLAESVRDRTFATLILGLFGTAGLTVTAFGLFAAVGFVVARRTREIAIRLAVGARAGDIRRVVMREAAIAAFGGACAGLITSRLTSRMLQSELYGIDSGNWAIPIAAAIIFTGVATVATLLPTGRALRLDPNQALRSD